MAISALIVALKTYISLHIHLHIYTFIHWTESQRIWNTRSHTLHWLEKLRKRKRQAATQTSSLAHVTHLSTTCHRLERRTTSYLTYTLLSSEPCSLLYIVDAVVNVQSRSTTSRSRWRTPTRTRRRLPSSSVKSTTRRRQSSGSARTRSTNYLSASLIPAARRFHGPVRRRLEEFESPSCTCLHVGFAQNLTKNYCVCTAPEYWVIASTNYTLTVVNMHHNIHIWTSYFHIWKIVCSQSPHTVTHRYLA